MRVRVISDLHIKNPDDPMYVTLLHWLEESNGEAGIIILLGDIFDLFLGSKAFFKHKYRSFFERIESLLQSGNKVFWVEGNHDFLLKSLELDLKGLVVAEERIDFSVNGVRFYFEHGDLVDTSDVGYLWLRRFFRSSFIKIFVKVMPGFLLSKLGDLLSKRSRSYSETLDASDVKRVREVYAMRARELADQGFQFIAMGHSHLLQEETLLENSGHFFNLGYPPVDRVTIEWQPGAKKWTRKFLPLEIMSTRTDT